MKEQSQNIEKSQSAKQSQNIEQTQSDMQSQNIKKSDTNAKNNTKSDLKNSAKANDLGEPTPAKTLAEIRVSMGDFPILRPETEKLLAKIVKTLNPNMVLELGTGKGFSGTVILSAGKRANLLTIEKDKDNYIEAMKLFGEQDFYGRVLPVNADAEEVVKKIVGAKDKQLFDLILLDCSKSSYVRMADDLIELLSPEGVLFADDVLYYGKVFGEAIIPKRKHRTIVVNLRKFIDKMQKDTRLKNVNIYEVEDGVLVAVKKTQEEINGTDNK